MGITVNFLIKHVRPIGSGYEKYCSAEMIDYLHHELQFSHDDIVMIFAQWKTTAEAAPYSHSDLFIKAANEVAQARWGELYPTDKSTLLFLDADQLAGLSLAGETAGANAAFHWVADEPLAICVTIKKEGNSHVIWEAKGCDGNTDANANVVHFSQLNT